MSMIRKIKNPKAASTLSGGTYLVSHINGVTYSQIVEKFGLPTYPEGSDDGKVNFEWVFIYKGNVFTLYDWKTYNSEYSKIALTRWNIGGKSYAGDFVEELEEIINS